MLLDNFNQMVHAVQTYRFVVNFLVRDYDALWAQIGYPEDIVARHWLS